MDYKQIPFGSPKSTPVSLKEYTLSPALRKPQFTLNAAFQNIRKQRNDLEQQKYIFMQLTDLMLNKCNLL